MKKFMTESGRGGRKKGRDAEGQERKVLLQGCGRTERKWKDDFIFFYSFFISLHHFLFYFVSFFSLRLFS
jgi:hypothetical protein